jgi:hypothetical protein
VDAGALASGPEFVGCFLDSTNANAAIASRALAYSGDTIRPGLLTPTATTPSTTNLQFQEPNDVRVALNATRYWEKADGIVPGVNGYNDLDNKLDSSDGDLLGDPCNERYLDVKATDDEAPPIWGLLPLHPSPKSHAKVEIRDLQSSRGMLPWAVPEIDPAAVAVLFVDEDDGSLLGTPQLLGEADNPALPWSEWTTLLGYETVTFPNAHEGTGLIVLVSKNDTNPLDNVPNPVPNTIAGYCGQAPGLVACYGRPPGQFSGLSFVHSYNGGGGGTLQNPIVRSVELAALSCGPIDYSAPHFTLDGGASCTATIRATIDFGPAAAAAPDPTAWPTCLQVDASPGGTMSWDSHVAGGELFTATMNLATGSGRNVLDLDWVSEDQPGGPNNCNNTRWSGSFSKVAAPYVADTASGPVQYLDIDAYKVSDGSFVPDPNSVEYGESYNYYVTVGFDKPHSLTNNYTDPPVLLRMASPSGSQNQAWDCDSNRNFVEEIESGCKTVYTENYVDPDGLGPQPAQWNNILCNGWGPTNLAPPTFGPGPSPYPSDCVITETGDKTGQLRDGLHARLETPCYDNKWPDDAAELAAFVGPNGSAYGTDPRYVTLIITDNTAFQGSGNEPLPIKYFAGFYVTGWDFHPTQSPGCPDPDGPGPRKGDDPHPIYGTGYQQSLDNGDVWGYFVDIVVFSGAGTPGPNKCAFGAEPAACIAILVE